VRQARVERVWYHDRRPVLKFEGMDSISDAEPWEGADILVEESQKAQPEEGEYSHADLIGCTLVNGSVPGAVEGAAGEERERTVGVVRGIEEYGGTPLLKVEAADGREILVPFARSICREIDVAHKIIRVQLPEGLMDL
jgi:16S rRNA processing protein RimM